MQIRFTAKYMVLIAALTAPIPVAAQITSKWIAPAGGPHEFGDSANWDQGVPGTTDTALIDQPGLALITAAGSVTTSVPTPGGPTHYAATQQTGGMWLLNGTVALQSGALQAVGLGGWTVNVEGAGGTLTITDFEFLNEGVAVVGGGAGQSGSALVTGPNAIWRSNINESGGWFAVGAVGTGDVTVANGGYISSAQTVMGDFFNGPGGYINVTGVGSQWDMLGCSVGKRGGVNLVEVEAGGRVEVGGNWLVLGELPQPAGSVDPDATGKIVIRDPSSIITSSEGGMSIGQWTSGMVVIEEGGTMEIGLVSQLGIQPGAGGSLLLTGAGSTLRTGTSYFFGEAGLIVGGNGVGTLIIDDGASCDAGLSSVYIAGWNSGVGTLSLLDPGSRLTGARLIVGNPNGDPASSAGMLIASGALAEFALFGNIIHPNGRLDLGLGALDTGGLSNEGVLNGEGTIKGNLTNKGLLTPGLGIGDLTIIDKLFLDSTGVLEIELGQGALAGQHDHVQVGNDVSFGGTLRLVSVGGFMPSVGDSFQFLSAATAVGQFDSIEVPGDYPAHVTFDSGQATVTIDPYPWFDQGCALAGIFGEPLLVGTGPLSPVSENAVQLTNAATFATAGLFLSFTGTPVPFKGGTLKPFPFLEVVLFTTDFFGDIDLSFTMPSVGIPSGTEIWVQWAISDGAAIQGVALSNAIKGVTP